MELPGTRKGSALNLAGTQPYATSSIVAVGEELLSGQTVDTNSAWLSGMLATLGMPVTARATVGDREADISEGVARLLASSDVVFVSGGLGPTHDDVTLDAVAGLLGLPTVEDATVREAIEARFRARGIAPMPESNRRMARVPAGAVVLGNPIGTAPALALEVGDRSIVLLPGVPRELEGIFTELVRPYLRERFGPRLAPVHHREIHTTGVPESELARRTDQALRSLPGGMTAAFLPDITGVTIRLSLRGEKGPQAAQALLDDTEAEISSAIGSARFHAPSGDLVEAVADALVRTETTVATAESCTGGLVAKRLTDRAGSSAYFLGGVVVYANDAKTTELSVDRAQLESCGAVSEEVAEALAEGVRHRFGSDAGIAVTGIAGPGGGTETKPVGTVCFAVSLRSDIRSRTERFSGDREAVRARSAQAVLALLLRMLEKPSTDEPESGPTADHRIGQKRTGEAEE